MEREQDGDRTPKPDNKNVFRFMDLPPEIRVAIYTLLFEDPTPIQITTTDIGRRRAVQESFDNVAIHGGQSLLLRDPDGQCRGRDSYGKWPGRKPSACVLSQVSKMLAAETLPLIYALKAFTFRYMEEFDVFFQAIGDAVKYLRVVHVTGDQMYRRDRMSGLPVNLARATSLRSLTFGHRMIADDGSWESDALVRLDRLVRGLLPFMRAIRKASTARGEGHTPVDVFEVVKVVKAKPCGACSENSASDFLCTEPFQAWVTTSLGGEQVHCNHLKVHDHVQRTSQKVKAAIARELGIEEPA